MKVMEPRPIHTIAIYPRPHPDTICAIFLLKHFGDSFFPGINQAKIEYWNQAKQGKDANQWEAEGILLVDIGGGKFDHHHDEHQDKQECSSTLVAKYLGIDRDPALKRLLQYVKRDDLEGKGIVSKDVIDRAFGLSAIVMNLNRDYPEYPEYVIDTVSRIFLAHYHEEYRRKILMPQELEELQRQGKVTEFMVAAKMRSVKVVMVETDNPTMVGFLRAVKQIRADVVAQRASSGHVNIITRQIEPRLNLRALARALRVMEARQKDVDITKLSNVDLEKPGRVTGIEEWYFDTAANTLQNGGVAKEGINPTRLAWPEIRLILENALSQA